MTSTCGTYQFPTSLGGVDGLTVQHRDAVTRAVSRILDTEIAVQTYSQIIDGVPLCRVARGLQDHRVLLGHPLESHVALCPDVVETALKFRADFNMETLKFDKKLLEAFQAATPDSRAFQLRLIELTAVTVHQTAVLLYKENMRLHDRHITNPRHLVDQLTWWRQEEEEDGDDRFPPVYRTEPWPTLFTHPQYCYYPQYPEGLADVVGYWAEDQIFGGVVLFDRSQPWNASVPEALASPEPNFYLHPARYGFTRRLWQVKDEEQLAVLDFLLSQPAGASSSQPVNGPLPLLPTLNHRVRIDPHYAMYRHKVYRDIWERPEPTDEDCYFWDRRPQSSIDYPELEDDFRKWRMK